MKTGFFSIGLLLLPREAFAYIDPGQGSMLLQILIGGIAGGLVFLKMFWKNMFKKKSKNDSPSDDSSANG